MYDDCHLRDNSEIEFTGIYPSGFPGLEFGDLIPWNSNPEEFEELTPDNSDPDEDEDIVLTQATLSSILDILRTALDDPRLARRALKLQTRLVEDVDELAEELGMDRVFETEA